MYRNASIEGTAVPAFQVYRSSRSEGVELAHDRQRMRQNRYPLRESTLLN